MVEKNGTDDAVLGDDEIRVTKAQHGYAHTYREGVCGKNVTTADIKKKFYDSMFGGRDARVSNGRFSVITHDD